MAARTGSPISARNRPRTDDVHTIDCQDRPHLTGRFLFRNARRHPFDLEPGRHHQSRRHAELLGAGRSHGAGTFAQRAERRQHATDKFAVPGFTPLANKQVRPSRVSECPVQIEAEAMADPKSSMPTVAGSLSMSGRRFSTFSATISRRRAAGARSVRAIEALQDHCEHPMFHGR